MFGLADCNNFYASCERLFRPALEGRPVVVLSNNDGCVIARSNEAKALGIAMGAPYFKVRELIERSAVAVFSSNYALYGDMSSRVMDTISHLVPSLEIYSIDEAFIDFSGRCDKVDYPAKACEIRRTVLRDVGIPVSIGVGATRTLAKVANRRAKKLDCGYFVIDSDSLRDEVLDSTVTGDVWGIGGASAAKLGGCGIFTAGDLCRAEDGLIRRLLGVVGLRTAYELRGVDAVSAEAICGGTRKSMCCSRSFGRPVISVAELKQAVAHHICRALSKLRSESLRAGCMTVFLKSRSPARKGAAVEKPAPRVDSASVELHLHSNIDSDFLHFGSDTVEKLFRFGCTYRGAGVILSRLLPEGVAESDFFVDGPSAKDILLGRTVDSINSRFGRGTLFRAAEGTSKAWEMKRQKCSGAYTTKWDELPIVTLK